MSNSGGQKLEQLKFMSVYPAYDRSERIADAIIHALGICLSLCGAIFLIVFSAYWLGSGEVAALSVYSGALIISFCASAVYHFTPWERARPRLRRLDHAAIYLKIAGTYTPLVVILGTGFGYFVLSVVWGLAVAGAVAKLFFWRTPGRTGPVLYLILGWLSLFLVWSLFAVLPLPASVLIVVGGALYSAGVIFFGWDKLKYSLAIWHGFVLAASACFFAAISLASFAQG